MWLITQEEKDTIHSDGAFLLVFFFKPVDGSNDGAFKVNDQVLTVDFIGCWLSSLVHCWFRCALVLWNNFLF
jgi:hypothetical protein